MARRFATWMGAIRANRFAWKKPIFITCERFAKIASNLRFAFFSPRNAIRRRRGSVRECWNDFDLRESDDSRESGHLSFWAFWVYTAVFGFSVRGQNFPKRLSPKPWKPCYLLKWGGNRPFFLGDNSTWSFPSVSSLSDYSIWRSWKLF